MIFIQEVKAREILESRGLPTVEVEVILSDGCSICASAPSGTSYGKEAAVEIRDKDLSRYHGYGVTRAVANVNKTIAPRLYKKDPLDQFDIDELLADLDGTPNKAHLGSNAILATSMAVAKAGAHIRKQQLFEYLHELYEKRHTKMFSAEDNPEANENAYVFPVKKMSMPEPIFNMIEGHTSTESKVDFQDFMIILKGIPNYRDKLRYASEIDHQIKKMHSSSDYKMSLMNQNGLRVDFTDDKDILDHIIEAINSLEQKLQNTVYFGLDIAATSFYNTSDRTYTLDAGKKKLTGDEFVAELLTLSQNYPIIFFEDPLADNDKKHWEQIRLQAPSFMGIVADDLFAGNVDRLEKIESEHLANAISLKPNQIGSVLDILTAAIQAQQRKLKIVVSHRSGETNDDYISDLAVAIGAEYFKAGSPRRGERVAKYNRLTKIEDFLDIINKTTQI